MYLYSSFTEPYLLSISMKTYLRICTYLLSPSIYLSIYQDLLLRFPIFSEHEAFLIVYYLMIYKNIADIIGS